MWNWVAKLVIKVLIIYKKITFWKTWVGRSDLTWPFFGVSEEPDLWPTCILWRSDWAGQIWVQLGSTWRAGSSFASPITPYLLMGRKVFKPIQIGPHWSSRPRTCSPDPTLIFGLWAYDPLVWSFSSKVENLSPWSHIPQNSLTTGTSFWVHRATTKHLGLSKISISGGPWYVFCTLGSLYHKFYQ